MKRGEQKIYSGSPAVALIGIITILFLGYILFLPPAERQALLEGKNITDTGFYGEVLLDEAPGRIEFIESNVIDHQLSNIYLASAMNAVELHKENPFIVEKGWFKKQDKTVIFSIPSLEKTENIILSFQAPTRKGVLHVSLNGQPIYESSVALQNPPPLTLPKQILQPTNQLTFWVTGGWLSKKSYSLNDVKIIGDVYDVSAQSAISTFSIATTELENLDTAALDFYPLCRQQDAGLLTITLNAKIIYSAIPSCEGLNRQELYKEDLLKGKNVITWHLEKGSQRVEQMRVRTTLEDVKTFIDYFKVNSSLYNKVLDNQRDIILKIEFVDDGTQKQARLNINGQFDMIDQDEPEWEDDISHLIREGNNYIELKPLKELNVARVKIEVE